LGKPQCKHFEANGFFRRPDQKNRFLHLGQRHKTLTMLVI
jgi:hypothetical protein